MQRIVDGIAYEGKTLVDAFDVRVWECNGHREISARPVVEWTEIGPAPDWSHMLEPDPERDERIEEDRRQKNLLRAARRAKTQCRRFIKSNGFDELATLTYRENQTDEKLAKAHFAKWARRMAELVPGFGYCVGYERQKRGAWHMHAAIYRLPAKIEVPFRMADGSWLRREVEAWKLGTIVWRRIVGKDGGMCFIGARAKGRRRPGTAWPRWPPTSRNTSQSTSRIHRRTLVGGRTLPARCRRRLCLSDSPRSPCGS